MWRYCHQLVMMQLMGLYVYPVWGRELFHARETAPVCRGTGFASCLLWFLSILIPSLLWEETVLPRVLWSGTSNRFYKWEDQWRTRRQEGWKVRSPIFQFSRTAMSPCDYCLGQLLFYSSGNPWSPPLAPLGLGVDTVRNEIFDITKLMLSKYIK